MAAREFSGTDPSYLLNVMVQSGQYEAAIRLVEERWDDLEAFDAFYGGLFGFGYYNMLLVAKAYLETGNQEQFEQAMRLTRKTHDEQRAQGANTGFLWSAEADYWVLANDQQKSIDYLERAVSQGWTSTPRVSDSDIILKPLEGDPRFEAVQARALERLNAERVEAGLEPLDQAYSL